MRVVLSVRFIGVERLAGAALAGKVFAHAAEQPLALRAGEVHRARGEGVSIEDFYVVPFIYAYSLLYWYRRMSAITELYLYAFPAPLTVIKYLFL